MGKGGTSRLYLKLGAEFQCLSFDAITAHTAVVLTRYMILAVEKRENEDYRTFGELFFYHFDEMADKKFAEVLELIFSMLREVLQESLFLSEEQLTSIINAFFDKLPSNLYSQKLESDCWLNWKVMLYLEVRSLSSKKI